MNDNLYRKKHIIREILLREENKNILEKVLETALQVTILKLDYEKVEENTLVNLELKDHLKFLDSSFKKARIDLDFSMPYSKTTMDAHSLQHFKNYLYHAKTLKSHSNLLLQLDFSFELPVDLKDSLTTVFLLQSKGTQYTELPNFIRVVFNMEQIMEYWYRREEDMIEKYKYLIMLGLPVRDIEILAKEDAILLQYARSFAK